MIAKIKDLIKTYRNDIFIALCGLLVVGIGYNLGMLNSHASPTTSTDLSGGQIASASLSVIKVSDQPIPKDTRVVVSKNSSSKVYHYTYCPGVSRIKPANLVYYPSASVAEAAGYTLAANCKP